jgi:glycosyltransferase involved in cell wall biosynthesis
MAHSSNQFEIRPDEVSVVIPMFNSSATLNRALKSVYTQSYPILEAIVVDDASDREESRMAEKICQNFAGSKYIRLAQNCGPATARNRGIKEARGTFVAFLDSDDIWMPDKIKKCIGYMQRDGVDFVGHSNLIGEKAHRTISDMMRPFASHYLMNKLDVFVSTSLFAPTTIVFRRGAIPVLFDDKLRRSEDYRLCATLIFEGYKLLKIVDFLSAREDPHILGAGLSGNADKMLHAHLTSVSYFVEKNYISRLHGRLLTKFIELKFQRHKIKDASLFKVPRLRSGDTT